MEKLIDNIVSNKTIFSGIAIFMVLLYHQPIKGLISGVYFYPGFSGVDIFLFFSGLGLCYSYNKNSLSVTMFAVGNANEPIGNGP